VNTNVSFTSHTLFQKGWDVKRHTTLPDDKDLLHQGLKEALRRSAIVIVTGGLGPTLDDCTKQVAASLFQSPLRFDDAIAAKIRSRFGDITSLEEQATVPTLAKLIPNPVGTAPGFIFSKESMLICLPGVPKEMEPMLLEEVIPFLHKNFPKNPPLYTATLSLCLLIENDVDPLLRDLSEEHPSLQIGIYPSYGGTLSVIFRDKEQKIVASARQAVFNAFAASVFPSETGKIEEAIHSFMIKHKKTLSLAESCTGGRIASKLTALSGSSNYFLGSIVCYSNEMKEKILNVSPVTLKEKGAVSHDAAQEMVQGLLKLTDADVCLAITGIAGPLGGSEAKPVGTMWAAIQQKGQEPEVWKFQERGTREKILLSVSNRLLAHLWKRINF
jgi:nicotinamide-nucleotide amidase